MTRWAAKVDPKKPLPEYPRPQLVRSAWLNLNGIWQYQSGAQSDLLPTGQKLSSQILVPYPVESALSGVMEHHDRIWYKRSFNVPAKWNSQRVKLNFGAVDYEAEVFINGQSLGVHFGGYEQFSYDITRYLKAKGPQELIVRVFDPTEAGGQPRGKQTTQPGGIMYTPTTGIWQTVWLEPVAKTAIQNLHMIPDVDKRQIRMTVNASGASPQTRAAVSILDSGKVIKTVTLKPGVETAISLPNPKLWSPDRPFLYNVKASLFTKKGNTQNYSDSVTSYFGMRKISIGVSGGVPKMLLNNKFVFQMGPLDQGFWPDGLYTAPTDEALKYDLVMTKKLGFNMTRKHIKVEPARWYYHADKLGLLVWQDMPSPNSYTDRPAPLDKVAFEKQLDATITTHWNSPAIVMWVIYNEGQARHDTAQLVARAKRLDPSRLTNRDSGAGNETDDGDGTVGDTDDVHNYPPPAAPLRPASTMQALECGEYGGTSYVVKGHTWKGDGWGYTSVPTQRDLEDLYGEYSEMLQGFRDQQGLSAAVYTQITDVEIEVNGLMTYDRIPKVDPAQIALANHFNYVVPTYRPIVETSQETPQTWQYTISTPSENWTQLGFDDSNWQTGQGAFGGAMEGGPRITTSWESDDIWLRRTFNPGTLSAEQIAQLVVRNFHDDDIEVFINGVSAYKSGGATHTYENKTMSEEARRAILPNTTNILAVHCHENAGDQHVDVGIYQRIPVKR
ncbi:glycoside hydrolase family 2 protein [Abditibacterium utsteinense]|nr:sugar-binding domain-containing protein [Abditibacterium utsteinense]